MANRVYVVLLRNEEDRQQNRRTPYARKLSKKAERP